LHLRRPLSHRLRGYSSGYLLNQKNSLGGIVQPENFIGPDHRAVGS
jgi:hypothetical protein